MRSDLTDETAVTIRSGDPSAIAEILEQRFISTELLAELLVRPGDGALQHVALLAIERRLATAQSRAALVGLAALLPGLSGVSPEVAVLLADLYRRLARWRQPGTLPDWRGAGLPVAVQIAWLRTELSVDATAIASEPFGERLLQALGREPVGTLAQVTDPLATATALAARDEETLQQLGVTMARRFLHDGLILPEQARTVLVSLVRSKHADVAAAALFELAQPWALLLPGSPPPIADSFGREENVATAALTCAARWKLDAPIRGCILDPRAPAGRRTLAMALYGGLGGRSDSDVVVAVAAEDPLLFGHAALEFLRSRHRRGYFLGADGVRGLVALFLGNHELDASTIAAIAFPARKELVSEVSRASPDDATWARRSELLVALASGPQGSVALSPSVAAILEEKLRAATEQGIRRALLGALGELRVTAAEATVLTFLESEPEDALAALRAVGGRETVLVLRRALGLDADEPNVRPALRPFHDAALTLAWHLSEVEPDLREALRVRFPRERDDAPLELRALAKGTDGGARRAELGGAGDRVLTASDVLCMVAAVAGPADLAVVLDLLLRVVSELDQGDLVNATEQGEASATIPAREREAMAGMGRRLFEAGSIRPRLLLDVADVRTAGPFFVSACARLLLDRADLTDGETSILLRALDPDVDRRAAPLLARMLRRREPQLRKVVVALVARHGADDLLASLTRLTHEEDIETVRQAIDAIGALGARGESASDALTDCLDHRTMNIKKSAAHALATAGGPGAVGKLVFWLGHHDNPGFRASVIVALKAILGPAYVATLVVALLALPPSEDRARQESFLLTALDGQLTLASARALCLRNDAFGATLVQALVARRIALASDRDGSLIGALLVELEAHAPGEPRPWSGRPLPAPLLALLPEVQRLLDRGFAASDAPHELLARSSRESLEWTPQDLHTLRAFWNEWVVLASTATTWERPAALALLARLAAASTPTPSERRLLAHHHAMILQVLRETPADPDRDLREPYFSLLALAIEELMDPLRLDVARALRALPERPNLSGRDAFALLRACGAILTRADVDRAIVEAKRTPDPAALERRVLRAAFGPSPTEESLDPTLLRDLDDAARAPTGAAIVALRLRSSAPAAQMVINLGALVEVFTKASGPARPALVDWMEALQPLSVPTWDLAHRESEALTERRRARERQPAPSDLDQPRSAALAARLDAMLVAPNEQQRAGAAAILGRWPEPAVQRRLAEAFVRGDIAVAPNAKMAAAFMRSEDELGPFVAAAADAKARLFDLFAHAGRAAIASIAPTLLEQYLATPDAAMRSRVARVLDKLGSDALLVAIAPRLLRGDWDLAGLLRSGLRSSPELVAATERAVLEGRVDVADRLRKSTFSDGDDRPDRATTGAFAAALQRMRARSPAVREAPATPTRESLFEQAVGHDVPSGRRALTLLAEDPDARLIALLHALLVREEPQVRLHAHRLLRRCAPRAEYLEVSTKLLDDARADVRRTAIRVVGFGRHEPSIPKLVALLEDPSPVVRRAAEEAVGQFGATARSALKRALSGARPDRRAPFQRALERIEQS